MVNNALGDLTGDGDTTTVEAGGAISAGDVLAFDQGATEGRLPVAVPAQDDTTPDIDQVAAIANEDIASGEEGTVTLGGPVIANVATGISQGERLSAGTTAGQGASVDGGELLALSGEGGTDSAGTSLGAGEAEVYL